MFAEAFCGTMTAAAMAEIRSVSLDGAAVVPPKAAIVRSCDHALDGRPPKEPTAVPSALSL
jgi:hypothetical protein